MSRSGYTDDIDDLRRHSMWRGAVASAIRGARGQAMLRELLAALDAMPDKALAAENLIDADGEVCALGALGVARGIKALPDIDPEDYDGVAKTFGIAPALVREIVYENDEGEWYPETPEQRWSRMRAWVAEQIKDAP